MKLGDRVQKACKWRTEAAADDALYAPWMVMATVEENDVRLRRLLGLFDVFEPYTPHDHNLIGGLEHFLFSHILKIFIQSD